MRSRLALLLLVPLAGLLLFVLPRAPAEVPLRLHLGARGAGLAQIDLKFARGEAIARDLSLHFTDGAPPDVERPVRLRPGDYTVAIRLVDRSGRETRDSRPQHVEAGEPLSLDLAFLAAR